MRSLAKVRVLMHFQGTPATVRLPTWPPDTKSLNPRVKRSGLTRVTLVVRGGLAVQAFAKIAHDICERQVACLFLSAAFVFDHAFVEPLVADDEAVRDTY